MPDFAPLKIVVPSFENALQALTQRGFEVSRPSGSVCTVSKYRCSASIEAGCDNQPRISAFPAVLIGGEPAVLLDRGFQKFFKTAKREMPATADLLESLHRFSEELKEALGYTSLYNEGLGSVSGSYQYDRASRPSPK